MSSKRTMTKTGNNSGDKENKKGNTLISTLDFEQLPLKIYKLQQKINKKLI